MPLRLYMDNDSLDRRVLDALRSAGVDILTTPEAGHTRRSDDRQLEFATAEGRTIYSANCSDFARLHAAWMHAGRAHAGIILRSQQDMSVGDQIRALRKICEAIESEDAINLYEYLDRWI